MDALVLIEHGDGAADEGSLQALTLARAYPDGAVNAVLFGPGAEEAASGGLAGVQTAFVTTLEGAAFSPDAWASGICELIGRLAPGVVIAAGSDRGNDVLARVAARLDLPLAANCTAAEPSESGALVTRVRWGGSLLEEAALEGAPVLLTTALHAFAEAPREGSAAVERVDVTLEQADRVVSVTEHVEAGGGGVSLAEAAVVVSGGRGVGSAEEFAVIEELAGLLGAAVGCSRAVTMAGWRPHSDQVGQTGTKIAPELYIACGISGATQHMAGCKGAKHLLAINADGEAPIFASADYAVIGDLHEVLPAIAEAIRKARQP
ncbi:MAG TPA: electron transfer flavoprotein subunit alpha/FixB family protein [Solirubrobacteraceae bacterium]|jgi:electron transfer flavoprotein alpha subunit|nr:electron transfer flavoprotein subunit alpha/FixB family protein [Solirubrobacteraceae bacterium]